MRRRVRALAAEVISCSDVLDDVESMTAEALANALIHGSGKKTVSVAADSARLRVSVWDEGPNPIASPNGHAATEQANHGRGLIIINASAARSSLTMEPGQTCLWFEIDLENVEAQTSPRSALPLGGESRAGGVGNSPPPALGSTKEDQ